MTLYMAIEMFKNRCSAGSTVDFESVDVVLLGLSYIELDQQHM